MTSARGSASTQHRCFLQKWQEGALKEQPNCSLSPDVCYSPAEVGVAEENGRLTPDKLDLMKGNFLLKTSKQKQKQKNTPHLLKQTPISEVVQDNLVKLT